MSPAMLLQKVDDGLAALLVEAAQILATLDGVRAEPDDAPPSRLARSLKDRAFRERMREQRLSRRPRP